MTYVNRVQSRVLDFYKRRVKGKKSNFKCLNGNECRIVMVQTVGENNNNNNKTYADDLPDVTIQNEIRIQVVSVDVKFPFAIRFFTNPTGDVNNSHTHTHTIDMFPLLITDNESADTGINERFCPSSVPIYSVASTARVRSNITGKTRARTRERLFAFLGHRR